MEKTIEVKVEDIKRAFEEANNSTKESLLTLFPQLKEDLQITDRVKTFEDACREVYIEPKLYMSKYEDEPADVTAYMKLRVICKALNEGWKPQFVEDERRYYPYFHLCSEEEIISMSEEEKTSLAYRTDINTVANGGVSYAYAVYDSADFFAAFGSRLALKTEDLAEYAGKQFIDLWADFCFTKKK